MNNHFYNNLEDYPKEEYMKKFGERLKSLRKSKKIRITSIIAQLDIHRSTYASWESGRRFPSIILLGRLADLLETNIEYLLLKTDHAEPLQDVLDLKQVLTAENATWGNQPVTDEQKALFYNLLSSMMNEDKTFNLIKNDKTEQDK